jgi:hypothetical protein
MVDRLKALGVMPGRDYARIKDNGETIVVGAACKFTASEVNKSVGRTLVT